MISSYQNIEKVLANSRFLQIQSRIEAFFGQISLTLQREIMRLFSKWDNPFNTELLLPPFKQC